MAARVLSSSGSDLLSFVNRGPFLFSGHYPQRRSISPLASPSSPSRRVLPALPTSSILLSLSPSSCAELATRLDYRLLIRFTELSPIF